MNTKLSEILEIDNQKDLNSEYFPKHSSLSISLYVIGIFSYLLGIINAICIFFIFSKDFVSNNFNEDKIPIAVTSAILTLIYHIIIGLICQGISKSLFNQNIMLTKLNKF